MLYLHLTSRSGLGDGRILGKCLSFDTETGQDRHQNGAMATGSLRGLSLASYHLVFL